MVQEMPMFYPSWIVLVIFFLYFRKETFLWIHLFYDHGRMVMVSSS